MSRFFLLLAAGCVFGTALAQLGDRFWLAELASHFPVQALIAAFVALPMMARDGRYVWVVLLLTAALLNARPLLTYLEQDGIPTESGGIQFAAVNLLGTNRDTSRFERWLSDEKPHVVAVAELQHRHSENLASLSSIYADRSLHPRHDNFGIGLLSRFPILQSQHFPLGGDTPAISAEIQTPSGAITVIAVHLRPPISPSQAAKRNRQLAALAERASARGHPIVILGDFNTTPYSPKLQALLREGDLIDASWGRGISYTWPRGVPLFRIPIDLCLVSDEFEVLDQNLGPTIGSDHWPLITSLRL